MSPKIHQVLNRFDVGLAHLSGSESGGAEKADRELARVHGPQC